MIIVGLWCVHPRRAGASLDKNLLLTDKTDARISALRLIAYNLESYDIRKLEDVANISFLFRVPFIYFNKM